MNNRNINLWVIIYSITALVLAAMVFVLYRLWPFWGDISGFIIEATGVIMNWTAMLTVITSVMLCGIILRILTVFKTQKGNVIWRPSITGRIGVPVLFLIWSLLLAGLLSEAGGYLWFSAEESYDLPDPLVCMDSSPVKSMAEWKEKRRPEILELFRNEIYGSVPARDIRVSYSSVSADRRVMKNRAIIRHVTVRFSRKGLSRDMHILIFLPEGVKGPCPAFMGMNFYGNQSVSVEPGIPVTEYWVRNNLKYGIKGHRADEKSRGVRAYRWPVGLILDRGYALVTVYYGDLDPDFNDGFKNGIHPMFYDRKGQSPGPAEWGSVSAWAWGLSRALDYCERDPDIDGKRVAVIGHSRLGKAALWAGAQDERFAMVISNNSGSMGAALSRRCYGETVASITDEFPHWFCKNLNKYAGKENSMPLDQHMLIALMAPRPVYVASAASDPWSDPEGEFLSALHASPVYSLYGFTGISGKEMPLENSPVGGVVRYHVRKGKHEITRYDWERYLDFADEYMGQ